MRGAASQVSPSGGKGQLLIPPEVVDKVLKGRIRGPTGMKGLAGIKNIVEKWYAQAQNGTHSQLAGSSSLSVLWLLGLCAMHTFAFCLPFGVADLGWVMTDAG